MHHHPLPNPPHPLCLFRQRRQGATEQRRKKLLLQRVFHSRKPFWERSPSPQNPLCHLSLNLLNKQHSHWNTQLERLRQLKKHKVTRQSQLEQAQQFFALSQSTDIFKGAL